MSPLPYIVTVPKKSFFDGQLTIPWECHESYSDHFDLDKGVQTKNIFLKIGGKKYPAKISKSYQKKQDRFVIHFIWRQEYDTKKALRKLFIYSFAATIRGNNPQLKECVKFEHAKENGLLERSITFKVTPIAQHKTDFDEMFMWMEYNDYFDLWKNKDKNKESREYIFQSRRKDPKWYHVNELHEHSDSTYVIYLLHHSKNNQFYVGKADKLGTRVKKGHNGNRDGLEHDWDMFLYFQIEPKIYEKYVLELEDWAIRLFASVLPSDVSKLKTKPIKNNKLQTVNRAALRRK